LKDYPITIGFDDASFSLKLKAKKKMTNLIGVICQGTRMVEVVRKLITIDGDDATEALIELISQKKKHAQYVLTDTITFAGFNICDLQEIYNNTGKPIIAVTEREIDLNAVKIALVKKFPQSFKSKFQKIINAGNLYQMQIKTAGGSSDIFYHMKGIDSEEVELLLDKICIDSKLPECVRMAHLIGKIL
jgi:hypothetical protein